MKVSTKNIHGGRLIEVEGDITSATVTEFEKGVKDAIGDGKIDKSDVVLDLSKVGYIYSGGLRVILHELTEQPRGKAIKRARVVAQERVVDTFKLVGFQALFGIFHSQDEAVKDLEED